MGDGIAAELDGIDLGDKRLNKRSRSMIETLAANPEASCNAALGGWAETHAAYRFFDNTAVQPDAILQPHVEATKRRMAEHPVVLIAQDTTELDYSSHPPRDARCLNTADRLGLYDHTHLALTPDRLPLGVVGVEYFDRDEDGLGQSRQRSRLPIEEKESFRWLTGYRLACDLSRDCPDTQIVSVADREADLYDIFLEAERQSRAHDRSAGFLIRAKIKRSTPERDPDTGPHAYKNVRDEVSRSKLRARQTLDLPRTPQRAARTATVEVRALRVTVRPPHERSSLSTVTYNVVLVEEIDDGPDDGTDVSWLLITSLPIQTFDDIQRVVDFYVARWTIEVFFKVFKTGCRVEDIQLETLSRLKNCLAFYKIIAWRVLWLTHLNRECPHLACDVVFEPCEWKSVWQVVTGTPPPSSPPSLSEFLCLLTELGGYNNRRTERPPGPQPVWTGIRRMTDFALAWLTFGPEKQKTCV